mgnify:CR=1 FL=1
MRKLSEDINEREYKRYKSRKKINAQVQNIHNK